MSDLTRVIRKSSGVLRVRGVTRVENRCKVSCSFSIYQQVLYRFVVIGIISTYGLVGTVGRRSSTYALAARWFTLSGCGCFQSFA